MLFRSLMECLLAVGIKARVVYMLPYSPYDGDNHVVCEAWVSELHKWIMVDPTYNAVVLDEHNEPLNIMEIRNALADRDKLHFANGLNYNGDEVDEADVMEYYAKDMFWFMIRDIQGCDNENRPDGHILTIVPEGYDIHKSKLLNIDYRISCWGDNDLLQQRKIQIEEEIPIFISLESLY